MKKIWVVGSLNIDMSICSSYIPKAGETVLGHDLSINCGGKGANQAVAASRLGGAVSMCGVVGKDSFGKQLRDSLHLAGVDITHVRCVDTIATGTAIILLTEGDNRIILNSGANSLLNENDIDEFLENAAEGDIFITQLENPIEVIGYGLKKAKSKGMCTVLNPAPASLHIGPYLPYVDIITPNESELEILGGKKALLQQGIKTIIVTLGSKGHVIIDSSISNTYPCHKVNVVDTTAAGDTFSGGLVVGLALGKTLEESAQFASKAATIACTRRGAQQSIPTRLEVEAFVAD